MSADGRSCLETKAGPIRLRFATDIDSQGRTNTATRLPHHAPCPRITCGALQVTVPPECGCDDDEAGNAPSAAVCDLRPQKNIFGPPFRDTFWWREQRMCRAILPAASRGRRLSHSPAPDAIGPARPIVAQAGSRDGRRVTTDARGVACDLASPPFMLSPMRTADHDGASLQGNDASDAWATTSQDGSRSAIASGPAVRPFPGEAPSLSMPPRSAAYFRVRDGRFDMIHPRSELLPRGPPCERPRRQEGSSTAAADGS
jgi:hypothetical protein